MTKVRGQSVKFRKGKGLCQTLPNFTASKRSHVLGGSRNLDEPDRRYYWGAAQLPAGAQHGPRAFGARGAVSD